MCVKLHQIVNKYYHSHAGVSKTLWIMRFSKKKMYSQMTAYQDPCIWKI